MKYHGFLILWVSCFQSIKCVFYEQIGVKISQNCTREDESFQTASITECVLHCGPKKCMDTVRNQNGRCYCVDVEKCRTVDSGSSETTVYSTIETPVTVQPICYEAKNTNYASFKVPYKGTLKYIRLLSVSGGLECSTDVNSYGPSTWGCNHQMFVDDDFLTVITNDKDRLLLPKGPYEISYSIHKFKVPGQDRNGKELLLVATADNPIEVQKGEELRVWHSEDLYKSGETDNAGRHCIQVYVKYC